MTEKEITYLRFESLKLALSMEKDLRIAIELADKFIFYATNQEQVAEVKLS